jgi:hypothetical protein
MNDIALDSSYFSSESWNSRVLKWLARSADEAFLSDNIRLVRQIMEHSESGLRVVVNISAESLLAFLADRRYSNLYDKPVIGGARRQPSTERVKVDQILGFGNNAKDYYFGAVALGGTGVRFYGEYCMTLKPSDIDPDTQIIDRDSYDLMVPPLADRSDLDSLFKELAGKWGPDVVDMLTLKLLPELKGANRLITTGTVSEMILHDQDFVEVHRRGGITPSNIEEIRQSPDEIAIEARIQSRSNAGFPPTTVELRWLEQRRAVIDALERERIHYRIVTLHGRGYQWR